MSEPEEVAKDGNMDVDLLEPDPSSDSEKSDSEQDAKLESRAAELEKEITANEYSYEAHVELVSLYKKLMDLSKLRTTYERFRKLFPLTDTLWLDWIKDEMKIACSEDEKKYILSLFGDAVKDYLSVDLWLEYVQYSIGNNDIETTRKVFENAVGEAGLHVSKGSLIWDAYRELELAHLSCVKDVESAEWETQAKRVAAIFKRQLSVTLLDMDRTYVEWRVWVEKLPKKDFIDKDYVEWNYKQASKYMDDYSDFEEKLLSSEDKRSVYLDYIKYERKPEIIISLYERVVADYSLDAELWYEYCMYIFNLKNIQTCAETIERALRNCPWHECLWIFKMQIFELTNRTHDEITNVLEEALAATSETEGAYLQLWLSYLEHYRRITNINDKDSVEKLRAAFRKAQEHLTENFGEEGDPTCAILRLWATLEARLLKNIQETRKIWNEYGILKQRGSQASFWLELIELERYYGDEKHVRKTYQRALTSTKDWAHSIIQSWMMYERQYGTVESMLYCMHICSTYCKTYERQSKLAEENQKCEEENDKNRKRKHDVEKKYHKIKQSKIQKQPKKVEKIQDVEMEDVTKEKKLTKAKDEKMEEDKQFEHIEDDLEKQERSVFISNLDYSTTEEELKEFVGPVEELRLVMDRKGNSKGYAYAIFSTAEEAKKMISRDREKLSSRPVFISKCQMDKGHRSHHFHYSVQRENHKLFVRGLPYSMSEDDISELFKPHGEIKEVRLATHRSGKSKGFAYVEYTNAGDAGKAVLAMDNKEVQGFTLSVAISAPPKRKTITQAAPQRHSKSRLDVPFIPQSVLKKEKENLTEKSSTSTLSNDDFRKMLLNDNK